MGIVVRGLKNVYRSRLRTLALLTLLALSVGISAGFRQATSAVASQSDGLTAILENTIEVRNRGATGMGAGADLLPEPEFSSLLALPNVVRTEKQLLVRTVDPDAFPSIQVTVGNEPGKPLRVATHGEPAAVRLVAGRILVADDAGTNVAVIGSVFAENRGLDIGDRFLLDGGAENPAVEPAQLEVVGIFSADFAFGDNQIFVPLDTVQRIFGLDEQVTVFWVTVGSAAGVDETARELRATLPDRDVLTSGVKAGLVSDAFDRIVVVGRIWLILGAALAGVVVLFSMVLATQERTREIGVLKAVGGSNAQVATQFIVEAAALSAVGALLGLLMFLPLGPAVVSPVLGIGDDPSAQLVEMGQAPLDALLVVDYGITSRTVTEAFGLVVALALIGSLYPVFRATRTSPSEALTHA